jgi:ammonia channel protein AmtB
LSGWAIELGAILAIVIVAVSLAVIDARMLPSVGWVRSSVTSLVCAATGVLVWCAALPVIAAHIDARLRIPIAALAGVAALLATIAPRGGGAGVLSTTLFGLVWSAAVFVPAALLGFSTMAGPFDLEPIDHGGALAVNVAAGAAALGALLAAGSAWRRARAAAITVRAGVLAAIGLSAGWILWLVTAELAIDDVTPSIILNGVAGALGGVVGWIVVQRIRHQVTTLAAVSAGLISGLVSITAGAPLFTVVSAASTGIVAGAAACIFTLRRVGSTRRQQWFIVGSHLAAGSIGVVLLGLLATGVGFVFTGRIDLLGNQVMSVILVSAYSAAVSFVLWSLLKRIGTRAPVALAKRDEIP